MRGWAGYICLSVFLLWTSLITIKSDGLIIQLGHVHRGPARGRHPLHGGEDGVELGAVAVSQHHAAARQHRAPEREAPVVVDGVVCLKHSSSI